MPAMSTMLPKAEVIRTLATPLRAIARQPIMALRSDASPRDDRCHNRQARHEDLANGGQVAGNFAKSRVDRSHYRGRYDRVGHGDDLVGHCVPAKIGQPQHPADDHIVDIATDEIKDVGADHLQPERNRAADLGWLQMQDDGGSA